MAYPFVRPYGLQPSHLIGGQVFSGSTRMFPIASSAANMFNGDLVKLNATGSITPTTTLIPTVKNDPQAVEPGVIGVFLGAEYTTTGGPLFGKMRNNYWSTAFSTAQDAVGYIAHDPDTVFKVAVYGQTGGANNTAAALTSTGYMSPAFVGSNVYYTQANQVLGNTSNGNSNVGVTANAPAASAGTGVVRLTGTNTTPFRVMDVVPETAVSVQTTLSSGSGTTSLTVASAAGIQPGMQIIVANASGAGSPSANTVVTGVAGNVLTVSAAITSAGTPTVTCIGYPEVLVKLNFGQHSYYNSSGV